MKIHIYSYISILNLRVSRKPKYQFLYIVAVWRYNHKKPFFQIWNRLDAKDFAPFSTILFTFSTSITTIHTLHNNTNHWSLWITSCINYDTRKLSRTPSKIVQSCIPSSSSQSSAPYPSAWPPHWITISKPVERHSETKDTAIRKMESTRRMERSWTRKMWSFGHVFYRREERRLAVLTEVCLSSLVLPVQCCHPARLLAPHAVPLGGHRLLLYSPLLHPPEGHRRVLRPLRLLHLLSMWVTFKPRIRYMNIVFDNAFSFFSHNTLQIRTSLSLS